MDGDVAEARSNVKRSYLWRFRNPACSDLIGSNRTGRGPGSCASWTCLGEVRRRAGVI